jgi:SAM-dependent methyltransferase
VNASRLTLDWPPEQLERVPRCPVCAESGRAMLYTNLIDRDYRCAPGVWTLWRCEHCLSAYLDPRPTAESIDQAYANYYTDAPPPIQPSMRMSRIRKLRRTIRNGYLNARFGSTLTPASQFGRALMWLFPRQRNEADRSVMYLQRPRENPTMVDIGCGDGAFLLQMQAAGWNVTGVEPNPDAVELARNAGLTVLRGVLEPDTFPRQSFDAVTMSGVLELLHEPVATLEICREILRPGGVFAVATPNLSSQGHAYFGRDWLLLSPPRSLVLFTPESLSHALRRAGLEPIAFLPNRRTKWTFQLSAALASGGAPFDRLPPPSARLQVRMRIADLRASRNPYIGEELIALARRPETVARRGARAPDG